MTRSVLLHEVTAFRRRSRFSSPHLPERQVDTLPAHQRMLAVGKRRDAVKVEPRRAAPYSDVAMLQPEPARFVAAHQSAEQESRGQAERHRYDRRAEIELVPVLMQRHARAGDIAVDQAHLR